MERTTLTIPPELRARLRRLAAERGVSRARVNRQGNAGTGARSDRLA